MSHQTKLFGIRRMAQDIERERVKLLGGAPGKDSAEFIALTGKIDAWQLRFEAIKKDLKSQSHFNHMMHRKQRFSPNAYAAGQQLRSKEANVRELSLALADMEAKLRDLIVALFGGKGGAVAALEAIGHVMGNWLQSSKHSGEGLLGPAPAQLQGTVAEIRSHTPGPSPAGGTPPMPVVDLFTLILAYFALLKSLSRK